MGYNYVKRVVHIKLKDYELTTDAGFFDMSDELIRKVYAAEFGTFLVPSRPFIRTTITENKIMLKKQVRALLKKFLFKPEEIQKRLAVYLVTLMHARIDTAPLWAVPLKASTIAFKGHNKPLIHTKEMYNSIKARSEIGRD